jgi:hypothetical protein
MRDVLALLEKNPEWSLVNAKIVPKSGFWTQKEQDKLKRRLTLGEGHRVGKS